MRVAVTPRHAHVIPFFLPLAYTRTFGDAYRNCTVSIRDRVYRLSLANPLGLSSRANGTVVDGHVSTTAVAIVTNAVVVFIVVVVAAVSFRPFDVRGGGQDPTGRRHVRPERVPTAGAGHRRRLCQAAETQLQTNEKKETGEKDVANQHRRRMRSFSGGGGLVGQRQQGTGIQGTEGPGKLET